MRHRDGPSLWTARVDGAAKFGTEGKRRADPALMSHAMNGQGQMGSLKQKNDLVEARQHRYQGCPIQAWDIMQQGCKFSHEETWSKLGNIDTRVAHSKFRIACSKAANSVTKNRKMQSVGNGLDSRYATSI